MNRRSTTFIRQLGQVTIPVSLGYGRLYNWYSVSGGTLAPFGWHIPTNNEWNILRDYLGGYTVAGGHLKENSLIHWDAPNTGADDSVGFSAYGGGLRNYVGGTFSNLNNSGHWWTTTPSVSQASWSRQILYSDSEFNNVNTDYNNGLSIRCIRPVSSYGALYNWYAADDARGLAPANCHIPTSAEWDILISYLGDGSIAGGKLKEAGLTNWASVSAGADGSSKFQAIPEGCRNYNGAFLYALKEGGYWWSSSQGIVEPQYAINYLLYKDWDSIGGSENGKGNGCAVRCICDTNDETITDIDGNIYDTVLIGTQRWLVQDLKVTKFRNGNDVPNVTNNTTWWDNGYDSTPSMCYINNVLPTANQPISVKDFDNNVYDVVEIGRQLWTKQNFKCTHLNDGTLIPTVTDNSAWSALTTGACCIYNNDSNNL